MNEIKKVTCACSRAGACFPEYKYKYKYKYKYNININMNIDINVNKIKIDNSLLYICPGIRIVLISNYSYWIKTLTHWVC